jgi:cytochrome c551/c552
MKRHLAIVTVVALCAGLAAWAAADIPDGVKALVQKNCAGCHKGKTPPKGLNLEPANLAAVVGLESRQVPGTKLVAPGAPEASYLLAKVKRGAGITGKPMPPGRALAAEDVQALEAWVAGLAK